MASYIDIPTNKEKLQRLSFERKSALWARYSPHPFKRQTRALWYYIQCERLKLKIEPKYMAKIRKYMKNPSECIGHVYRNKYKLTPGLVITKTFRKLQFQVMVADNGDFLYAGQTYKSLSAVAKEICGKKVSGYDFFGLNNKRIPNGKN